MLIDVFKLGGGESENQTFLQSFAAELKERSQPFVVVHGGGREVARLQQLLGIVPRYVAGLRVTDATTLKLVEMVLVGEVNKRLVRLFNDAGLNALGLSGADMRLLRARKMLIQENGVPADLGYVGEITGINTDFLHALLAQGVTPVIAPVAYGEDGCAYNVNADQVAVAVAKALGAAGLSFITDVPGVLGESGLPMTSLSLTEAQDAIRDGIVRDGMIPKVKAAAAGVVEGIPHVSIGRATTATRVYR
ncbi:Acetylglutamate kinase [Sulfidibacter corallicola]|uniref:Acetylglutamate kinase n=1 Tax=Sulfidibacter corallicola TaxID=2818388 RepID=A0A8A4TWD0_SULCO|nr:acetylglutamate kinase [Sulfidibacter corallicola]QTD53793.1 acetylglutamate kinase [Sulfidibacter corallicola]